MPGEVASAAGGRRSERNEAQRSKKAREIADRQPMTFSGTARGVAQQLRILLPLPN